MGIFERLKKILKNKPVINETNLARIDTDLVFIPSFKKLTKEDQEKVLNYIKEININDLDSLVNYAKELSEEANFDTEILLRLYYKLIDENEVNEDNENIIYDKYKTIISINELNLCKNDLNKLRNEGILRVVSLEEVLKKELSRKLTFLGMFSKVEKNKRENDINSLKDEIERTKIVIKVIEQLISTVNNSVSNNTLKIKRENVFLSLTNEKDNKEILNELVEETKELIKRFLPVYENELVFDIENVDSCLFNISIAKRLLDLYAYKHKDEIEKINEKVIELTNKNKTIEDKEDLLKIIKEIELIYIVFKSYLKEEYLLNFYQLKFDVLCLDLSEDKETLFKNIKDKKELLFYKKIVELKLDKILTGNNEYFEKAFDKNTGKAIGLIRGIIKKEVGNYSGENILNNRRVLAFILAFDQEDGFEKFITKNYFNKNDLVYDLNNTAKFQWNDELPLKTIYQLECIIKNDYSVSTKISPWVKLLKNANISKKIENIFDENCYKMILPEGLRRLTYLINFDKVSKYEILMTFKDGVIINNYLKEVSFPTTLKEIGLNAFNGCENLTKINFNEGLEFINDYEFEYCENLKELLFPSSLKKIGKFTFYKCKNLTKIDLNEGLEIIGNNAFEYCEKLKQVSFPSSLKIISPGAFEYCENLSKVKFNEGLEIIEDGAFSYCVSLKDISLPTSLKKIGEFAFCDCKNLTKIDLNEGLEGIDTGAFDGCENLEEISFPSSISRIGVEALSECKNLTKIKLNEGLEIIDELAFSCCENLQEISFPSSLKEMGRYIFVGCENLQKIIVSPHKIDVESPLFYEITSIKKQINLVISGIEIEDGCLQNWLRYNLRQIKSIEIMDNDIIAIHYDIKNDNTEEIINEVNKKLDEYKRNNKSSKVKKLSL